MSTRSLTAMVAFDLKNVLRDKIAVGMLLVFPLGLYIFFGTFFGATATPESAAKYYSNYTINFASVVLLNIAFLNLGPTIVMAKDMGLLRRLMATPLRLSELWLSSVVRTLVVFAIGYFTLLLSGFLVLGQVPPVGVAQLLAPALISAFTMLSLGFLLGAFFQKPMAAFNGGMVLIQPMLLLSGAGLPAESFPKWAITLSQVLPFTHVVTIMRMGWKGEFFTQAAVAPTVLLLVIGATCAALAVHLFRKDFN